MWSYNIMGSGASRRVHWGESSWLYRFRRGWLNCGRHFGAPVYGSKGSKPVLWDEININIVSSSDFVPCSVFWYSSSLKKSMGISKGWEDARFFYTALAFYKFTPRASQPSRFFFSLKEGKFGDSLGYCRLRPLACSLGTFELNCSNLPTQRQLERSRSPPIFTFKWWEITLSL